MAKKTYDAFASGPDGRSTYPECWGSNATSLGYEVIIGANLDTAIDAAQRDGRAVDIFERDQLGRAYVGSYCSGEADRLMRSYLDRNAKL